MTKRTVVAAALALAAIPFAAHAQTPPPPAGGAPAPTEPAEPAEPPEPGEPDPAMQPPPPPPPASTATTTAIEKKLILDVGLFVGLPQGDISDGASASPGLRAAFGYLVAPHISVHGFFRYVMIQLDQAPDGLDYSYYDIGLGARYQAAATASADVFAEAEVASSTLSASYMGDSASESDLGFMARGGGIFRVAPSISIVAAASYSHANISDGDVDWLSIEGSAEWRF